MNDRDRTILDAAWRVFARYGLSKTTMNDIAREAGVARQTLYNAYDGKDHVFRAVVREGARQTMEQIDQEWRALDSLSEKIDVFFRLGPITWYDMIANFPDSANLIEGFNETAKEELRDTAAEWVTRIAEQFEPYRAEIAGFDMTPVEFADFLYSSAKSAKNEAPSREMFLLRLKAIKASVLAVTRSKIVA